MLIDNTVWVQHSEIRCETSTQKRLKEAPILGLSILRKICCEPFSWFKRPVEKSNYTRPLETHVAFDVFVSRLVSRQAHRLKSHLGLLKELTNNMAFRGPRVEARFTTVHSVMEVSKLRKHGESSSLPFPKILAMDTLKGTYPPWFKSILEGIQTLAIGFMTMI